jgi:acyl carrier protein
MVVRLQQMTGLKVKAEDFKQIRTLDDVVGVVEKLVNEQGK